MIGPSCPISRNHETVIKITKNVVIRCSFCKLTSVNLNDRRASVHVTDAGRCTSLLFSLHHGLFYNFVLHLTEWDIQNFRRVSSCIFLAPVFSLHLSKLWGECRSSCICSCCISLDILHCCFRQRDSIFYTIKSSIPSFFAGFMILYFPSVRFRGKIEKNLSKLHTSVIYSVIKLQTFIVSALANCY